LVARLLALVLAALWLPLTMHCQWADCTNSHEMLCCDVGHSGCSGCGGCGDCHSDVCKIIETGKYFLKKANLSVPPASFVACGSLEPQACLRLPPPVVSLTEATGAPPGWNRAWQFVFRAASTPRAPAA
jgi:hypothetical protein